MMNQPIRTLVSTAVLAIISTSMAHASAFSLYLESAPSTIGNYGAGVAAEAADASTGWYNPAGLALLHDEQMVFGGVGVFPSSKMSGTSTYTTPNFPPYVQQINGLQGGVNAFVPSFHYAKPIGSRASVGFSMVSPFGLSTDWGDNSPVRYAGTFTEILTTNLSPEVGGLLTDNLAIGGGLDLQYSRVKFNRMLGAPTLNPALDSLSYNKGDSYGVGFHTGIMGLMNDNHTRVGLNYQSEMRHRFHGYSVLRGPLGNPAAPSPTAQFRTNDLFSNEVKFPSVTTLSAYHDLNNQWALLGSVVYVGWDVAQTLQLSNVAAYSSTTNSNVKANSTSVQNYKNSWRYALGANYHLNDKVMFRGGVGYDQTPTNDVDRDIRLPDSNRIALSVGSHYQMQPNLGFDLGYTYIFSAQTPVVNKTEAIGTSTYNVNVTGKSYVHLLGLQATWTMDKPVAAPTK